MNYLSIVIMAIATAIMIFAIWSKNISRAKRTVIVTGYLLVMIIAVLLENH